MTAVNHLWQRAERVDEDGCGMAGKVGADVDLGIAEDVGADLCLILGRGRRGWCACRRADRRR
jgi:hypothetical protein